MAVNLIGVHGRIGSGKDTIGKIIQYLIFNKIYGFNDSVELSSKADYNLSGWKIKKFAGKLKTIASILTGIPVEKFEDQEFKKTALGNEWFTTKPYIADVVNVSHPMTVRELLQKLGTDALRNNLHTNVWVNALFADFNTDSKWIITDLRFKNEYDAIKERGGICIRVLRDGTKQENEHISETALDQTPFDYTVHNNGSIEGLTKSISEILRKENIL